MNLVLLAKRFENLRSTVTEPFQWRQDRLLKGLVALGHEVGVKLGEATLIERDLARPW
jgi:hypothetical protein